MEIHLEKVVITISEAATTIAKKTSPFNSYVIISIQEIGKDKTKELFLGSRFYRSTADSMAHFYENYGIGANINLFNFPHGGFDDRPDTSMPKYKKAALELHRHLSKGERVLVNCNNGRSRSGTLIALYLKDYLGIPVESAIFVVNQALLKRGFKNGIDCNGGAYGTYAEWLRADAVSMSKENPCKSRKRSFDKPLPTSRTKEGFFASRLIDTQTSEVTTHEPIFALLSAESESRAESFQAISVPQTSTAHETFFSERLTRSRLKAAKEAGFTCELLEVDTLSL